MEKRTVFAMLVAMAIVWTIGNPATVNAAQPGGAGPHYELKIGGFAQCKMDPNAPGTYPDCFNGNAGPGGHVIFVPLKTAQENVCQVGTTLPNPITVADLLKGVRILVTDGPDLEVLDKDATDGTATFQIPNGCYEVWAAAKGKPGGCADIDTLICCAAAPCSPANQVACDPNLGSGQAFALVGHIDVDRPAKGGKPKYTNVTNQLLGTNNFLVKSDGFFDFFWQIFNDNVRVISLRIQEVACQ